MSELFLAQKSTQLNGNNFYYSLVAAFRFMMLKLSHIIFVLRNLEIIYLSPKKEIIFIGDWALAQNVDYFPK